MQLPEQLRLAQCLTERNPYRTPKLLRHGRLASTVHGGETATSTESGTDFTSNTL